MAAATSPTSSPSGAVARARKRRWFTARASLSTARCGGIACPDRRGASDDAMAVPVLAALLTRGNSRMVARPLALMQPDALLLAAGTPLSVDPARAMAILCTLLDHGRLAGANAKTTRRSPCTERNCKEQCGVEGISSSMAIQSAGHMKKCCPLLADQQSRLDHDRASTALPASTHPCVWSGPASW